ncbi:hypothetical protein MSMTP_1461 [Methanosarcina sp. MTP4]|nr:hypothetical protein MSMTP_1461 [Methanosarcina sp. MTP4]
MNPEALKQLLTFLDIDPDNIEDETYAKIIRTLLFIIKGQNREIEFLKAETQKLRDEINLEPIRKVPLL